MKTIFITSFHPFISRNILSTNILSLLKKADIRIIILTHKYKTPYFEAKFKQENVIIEGVDTSAETSGFVALLFRRIARAMLDTSSTRIQKRWKLYKDKNIIYYLSSWVPVFIGKFKFMRRFIRFLDFKFSRVGRFKKYFETYNPDLIFATDIQNEHDVCILQAGKKYRIKTIGMVRSWDNLTSYQGIMRIIPDRFLVGTEILLKEAVYYHDVPANIISIVGKPHYDGYLEKPRMTRGDFCKMMELNPEKKIVFFNPWGDHYAGNSNADKYVLEFLKEVNANILVRFNPGHKVTLTGFTPSTSMVFDRPGVVFNEGFYGDRDISEEDDRRLLNELYHSDVIVTCSSTIVIDAAVFDRPIIGVALSEGISWWGGVEKFYYYEHFQNIVKTGGMKIARTKEEMLKFIQDYLLNPELDKKCRQRIIEEQCNNLDGKSTERLAESLIKYA